MPLTHGRTAAGDQKPAAEKKKRKKFTVDMEGGRTRGTCRNPARNREKPRVSRERADKEGMTLVKVERVKDGRARVHDINERVTGRGVSVYLLSSRRKSKGFIL